MNSDSFEYLTAAAEGRSLIREKGSRFLGFSYPCPDESEAKAHLDALWQKFPDATHICWAYVPESPDLSARCSDDGEPSGTAGKPILNQIMSAGLKNVLVAVVRYYGGSKLGTSGLIASYKSAAEEAIQNGGIRSVERKTEVRLSFPYSLEGKVNGWIKKHHITVSHKTFSGSASLTVLIPNRVLHEALAELTSIHGLEVRK